MFIRNFTDIFKIKAAVSFPKPSLYKLNSTIKYFAYLYLQLKESLVVDSFHAYLRYLFVTRYNCLCFISMFAWIILKRLLFCTRMFE